jgi:hypothetical protein
MRAGLCDGRRRQRGQRAEMRLGLVRVVQDAERDEAREELLVGVIRDRPGLDELDQRIGVLPVIVRYQRPREVGRFPPQGVLLHGVPGLEGGGAMARPELEGDRIARILAQVTRTGEEEAGVFLVRAGERLQAVRGVRLPVIEGDPGIGGCLAARGQAADFSGGSRGTLPGKRLEARPFVIRLQQAAPLREEG